jgi:hypothetical protein
MAANSGRRGLGLSKSPKPRDHATYIDGFLAAGACVCLFFTAILRRRSRRDPTLGSSAIVLKAAGGRCLRAS